MRETPHVTKEDIKAGLGDIGLEKGDLVVVHSSLSAFGYVEGGADTVIDALIETLGQAGTLIMPSFTGLRADDNAGYDRQTTPATVGIISDTFWKRRDVIRSSHPPRKPWAVCGRLAPELITLSERRLNQAAQHYLGILDAVADLGGYVLLLGCLNSSNTSIHTAQVAAFNHVEGAHKCIVEFLAVDAVNHTPGDGPTFFTQLDAPLLQTGVMRMGRIGDAEIRLMRSREMFDVVESVYETKYWNMDLPEFPDYIPDPSFPIEAEYKETIEKLTALQQVRSE